MRACRASFKVAKTRTTAIEGGWLNIEDLRVDKATVNDIDAIIKGTHPLSVIVPDDQFQFESGKELAYFSVYFDGVDPVTHLPGGNDIVMIIAVVREDDRIAVTSYLVRNGEIVDTSGYDYTKPTILGTYELLDKEMRNKYSVTLSQGN